MAAEFGFTAADINSMTSAREGLVAGFMQLGKQIQQDITRIATIREMKAFGQEMANLDPTSDAFPQQLIGTLSKYPLAANTPIASRGIEVLGSRYRAAQQLKTGGVLGQIINTVDEEGNPIQMTVNRRTGTPIGQTFAAVPKTPKTVTKPVYNAETGVTEYKTFDTSTADEIGTLGQAPPSAAQLRIPADLKAELDTVRQRMDVAEREFDRIKKAEQEAMSGDDEALKSSIDNQRKMVERAINDYRLMESEIIQRARDRIPRPGGSTSGLPEGAGQGMGGPSLMPTQQQQTPFVPIGMPINIAAPKMTLRQEGDAILPDQLHMPGVVPTPKQAGTPRRYKIVNGKFQPPSNDPAAIKDAVEQAFADQVITEAQRANVLRQAGLQ